MRKVVMVYLSKPGMQSINQHDRLGKERSCDFPWDPASNVPIRIFRPAAQITSANGLKGGYSILDLHSQMNAAFRTIAQIQSRLDEIEGHRSRLRG